MKLQYIDLVTQSFDFPQKEFTVNSSGQLSFQGINLMPLIIKYGTPLKISYLPQISQNIQRAKHWFNSSINRLNYKGNYNFCYCTKSSHFSFVLDEVLKNDVHIETSSAFDIDIVNNLIRRNKITKDHYIICNGFKRVEYIDNIANLINSGYHNTIPILDNEDEFELLEEKINTNFNIGIRIASEEEPKFEFYTSRLGIGYKDILPFYREYLKGNKKIKLKMLHFFINTGIKDTAYYWNELGKCLLVYTSLKKICPELDSLNIGGGFPIKNSLNFDFDYAGMVDEIITQIQTSCKQENVATPNIFTEFGSFTVGESGAIIYTVLHQKNQNDREKWNMINSSFITTLPDTWAISKKFLMLPINRWFDSYERVFLGGLTCDSDDYYNSEQHTNSIHLPKFNKDRSLHIGFFNTGAYQDSIGGFGGIQHCLIPQPQHVILDYDKNGVLTSKLFAEEQTPDQMLNILGYKKNDDVI